jgi:predicted dehydrogenase
MAVYRAGIVGLTGIASGKAGSAPHDVLGSIQGGSHASGYAQVPATRVVGACDLVPALTEQFVSQWGAVWPEVRPYGDYRQLLDEGALDLLSVVTSDHRHAQIVVDAAEAGVKGIYCEKPIATTLADADRMIAACKASGTVLSIDHTRRWRPIWHQVRNLINSPEIGPLRRIVATLSGPRAMLFRNGTHLLDMVTFFAGSAPTAVIAELDDEHKDYGPVYAGDGGRDPATDPGGSAYIHFQNGVRAFVNASKTDLAGWEFVLHCQNARIRVDDSSGAADVWQHSQPSGGAGGGPRRAVRWLLQEAHTTSAGLRAGIEEIVRHVDARREGRDPGPLVSPPEAARQVLEILLGILQSNHGGSTRVTFPVRDWQA